MKEFNPERRLVLKALGASGALGVISPSLLIETLMEGFVSPESRRFRTAGEVLTALWKGEWKGEFFQPTLIDINGFAAGQIQAREYDPANQAWEPELPTTLAWIHRYPDDPLGMRGLVLVHRGEVERIQEAVGRRIGRGTRFDIFANWDHGQPVLSAQIYRIAYAPVEKFDQPEDLLIRQIANSLRTVALASCDPPGCEKLSDCPRNIVYYGLASLPK